MHQCTSVGISHGRSYVVLIPLGEKIVDWIFWLLAEHIVWYFICSLWWSIYKAVNHLTKCLCALFYGPLCEMALRGYMGQLQSLDPSRVHRELFWWCTQCAFEFGILHLHVGLQLVVCDLLDI